MLRLCIQYTQSTYEGNIEARSRNHCCCEKAISITYSECVSVAFVIQPAMRMRAVLYCHLRLSGSAVLFPHYVINGKVFRKKVIEHKMCLNFLYNFCLKHFSIKKNPARHCHICTNVFNVKCPLFLRGDNETSISSTDNYYTNHCTYIKFIKFYTLKH